MTISLKTTEWFAKADHDLRAAEIIRGDEEPPTDTVCFHCQQAVEKYLKGYLVQQRISFPKTYDVDFLLEQCIKFNSAFEKIRSLVAYVSEYAIEPRYPADIPIAYSLAEAKGALDVAKQIKLFVIEKI